MDEFFEQLFDRQPDACSLLELDGDRIRVVRANPAQAARFGLTQAALAAADLRSLAPPELYASWLATIQTALATDTCQSIDLPGPPPVGGRERATVTPLAPGPDGRPRCLVQIRDETERQAATEALARSEARLARAQELGQVGDWVLDLATGTGTWSREMFRIAGWPGDTAPSHEEAFGFIHADDRTAYRAAMQRAVESDGPVQLVFRAVTPAGEPRRLIGIAQRECDADGRPVRLVGTTHDVTALEDALALARQHEAELQVLFDDNVDGVFFITLDEPLRWSETTDKDAAVDWVLDHSRQSRVNRALAAIHGVPAAALVGLPMSAFTPDRAEGSRQLRALYDAGFSRIANFASHRPDGSAVVVDIDSVVIRDLEGRITGQFGIARDVTARERAAEALRQSEAQLQVLFNDNVAGVFFLALDAPVHRDGVTDWAPPIERAIERGRITRANAALAALVRLPIEQVIGLSCADFMVDRDDARSIFRSIFQTGRFSSPRIALRRGDGSMVEVELDETATRDRDGAITGKFGIVRDLTERRALEQRLQVAERMAALGTLAAGVGHEINNPLTYVITNLALVDKALAEMVAEPASTPTLQRRLGTLREMAGDARDGATRVARIVRDLRTLTRTEAPPDARVDVAALLERCLALCDHQLRHRARLVRDLAPVPPVVGDQGRLTQLFVNLLINAAQAIPEGAAEANQVQVSTRVGRDGRVMVEVTDSGAGMTPEVAQYIFDPFFTTKAIGEGTGLGLAICHAIVTELGGTIEVASEPGRGSRFRIQLPAAAAEARRAAPAAVTVAAASGERLRILVIDDEAVIGRLIGLVLDGHAVVAETRAADALGRLRDGERFDRILCDLMMPEMSGIDFYQALAAIDPALQPRVIFMTGGAFTERARAFLAATPNRTLAKPFETDALLALLAAAVPAGPPAA